MIINPTTIPGNNKPEARPQKEKPLVFAGKSCLLISVGGISFDFNGKIFQHRASNR